MRPGPKPKGKVICVWSPEFAYALGLIATDGCLSGDGRHLELTSKDIQQLHNFMRCLGIQNKIGKKISGYSGKPSLRVQFGDVLFYQFLLSIGFSPAKSKILGKIDIPQKYFFDFLRGAFDGDGTFYSYYDPRWKSSFMFYTVFISASIAHIEWMRSTLFTLLEVKGHVTHAHMKSIYQLKYAKKESLKILKRMYYKNSVVCLSRKRLKVEKALSIIGLQL